MQNVLIVSEVQSYLLVSLQEKLEESESRRAQQDKG